jgi:hypothetical protein
MVKHECWSTLEVSLGGRERGRGVWEGGRGAGISQGQGSWMLRCVYCACCTMSLPLGKVEPTNKRPEGPTLIEGLGRRNWPLELPV